MADEWSRARAREFLGALTTLAVESLAQLLDETVANRLAHERGICARICDLVADDNDDAARRAAEKCGRKIRARGPVTGE